MYTWKGLVTERTVTFSYSIFFFLRLVFSFYSQQILYYLVPQAFINILYLPLALYFLKLKLKLINKALNSSSDASLLIMQQKDRTQ